MKRLLQNTITFLFVCFLACGVATNSFAQNTIEWSGMTWDIKSGNGLGPGPNNWSDSSDSVWVDVDGNLHLTVRKDAGVWYSAEIIAQESLGYGDYEFRASSNTESFDQNVVAGFFTYLNDDNEIDIELARFGDPSNNNAHFTTQPYFTPGNSVGFDLGLNGTFSTHSFNWNADRIEFESLHGHHSTPPTPANIINQWTYTGSDIPLPSSEKVRINFWLFQGQVPTNGLEHELVINSFQFTPAAAVLLGDIDLNGVVDFSDIPPFIAVLLDNGFQEEADTNLDGMVTFLDIPSFINILIGQ